MPELDKALALGNNPAGLLLADYYLSQANSEPQMKQARDIYQHIAEHGDKEGQLKLAYMYQQGLGGVVDTTKAQDWYTQAAEQGEPVAQYLLGRFYQLGLLDKKPNYPEAKKWYNKAQTQYTPAAVALGFIYDTVDDHYQQALQEYERAAQTGDAVAQYNAGLVYQFGKGYPVDYTKASALYITAAEHGHAQAMVQLAHIYFYNGSDQQTARAWYKKAANLGNRDALYQLGLLSETGVTTKLDYAEALQFYDQAAKLGNTNAKLALARMYQYGLGVTKDIQHAYTLYQELAENNNAYAQYQLAMFSLDGTLGTRNPAQAKQWLQQAENNGSQQASKVLEWIATQAQDRKSFIETALISQPPVSSSDKSADLMYLDALNSWNRGDEMSSRVILSHILSQYPDYVPAKRAYEQLQQDRLGAWGQA